MTLPALLRLTRPAAVCTAPADVCAGFALAAGDWQPYGAFGLLCAASVCLYAGGMVLNDALDVAKDAAERPDRPIPAGEVTARTATAFAAGLLAVGVALAAAAGFLIDTPPGVVWLPGAVAAALAALIVLYDGPLKRTPLAPAAMGGCRALNLLLGASVVAEPWAGPPGTVAAAMGVYVAGLTLFARDEAVRDAGPDARADAARNRLVGAATVGVGLLVLSVAMVTGRWSPKVDGLLPAVIVAGIAVTLLRRLVAGVTSPGPDTIGPAVRLMVLSIVTLDAATVMAATGSPVLTLLTCALLIPALLLKRLRAVE